MTRRLTDFVARTGARIEAWEVSVPRLFLLFGALLSIRLVLEFFSNQRLFRIDDVIHIGLWFTFVVLAFITLLHAIAGIPVIRAARLAVVCYVFSWSAPLIDLLLFQGRGVRMAYLSIGSPGQLLEAYLTFGGPSILRGATPGIRIEIACLVLACFIYVYRRQHSLVRAALAAIAIYTMLFLTGAIPYLLNLLVQALGLSFSAADSSTILLLWTLDLGLLTLLAWRHAPAALRADHPGIVRGAVPWFLVMALAGAWLAHGAYPDNRAWTASTLFWPPLLLWLAVMLVRLPSLPASWCLPAWLLGTATVLLLEPRLLLGFQSLVASQWLGLAILRPIVPGAGRGCRVVDGITVSTGAAAALLFGFQVLGGPMIGVPTLWILVAASGGAIIGALQRFSPVTHPDPA